MLNIDKKLKDAIVEILSDEYERGDKIFYDIENVYNEISADERDYFYSGLLFLLTHLEFDEKQALSHWKSILKRYKMLKYKIGREINLRVAVIDYFTTDFQLFKNPIIIDIFLYEVTEKKALIDEMTGLHNFRYLKTILESEYNRSKRYGMNFCVAFIDMDNLKRINDTFGHLAGDEAIKRLANIIKKNKRTEDVVCRYGGDEFIFLLPQTYRDGAMILINRIREEIETIFKKHDFRITVSSGISEYPSDSKDPMKIIELADMALYRAKYNGKNQVVSWGTEE